MEQIEQEQLELLARKAQLQDELKAIETALSNIAAFAQGFKTATAAPAPTPETPQPTKE